jgi:hypothetical protein
LEVVAVYLLRSGIGEVDYERSLAAIGGKRNARVIKDRYSRFCRLSKLLSLQRSRLALVIVAKEKFDK